ncbi:MAG: NAD(+)/NADH kinase [Planctomycetota bacterium]
MDRPRVLLLPNLAKDRVTQALSTFRPWLAERSDIVAESGVRELSPERVAELPEADLAIVLGGDGTLLAAARALLGRPESMLGINFGKLGFLAEFQIDDAQQHWESVTCGQCRHTERVMMDVRVYDPGAPRWGEGPGELEPVHRAVAMNDTVINAGPPFRMLSLELAINPMLSAAAATVFRGDGVVVCTPSGSTAYNLSAGGPIISPGVEAFCVAPLNPQSLSFRPIVFGSDSDTWIAVDEANDGTALVLDGQFAAPLRAGQQVRIVRHPHTVRLIHNPDLSYWSMLAQKMHWAAAPRRHA